MVGAWLNELRKHIWTCQLVLCVLRAIETSLPYLVLQLRKPCARHDVKTGDRGWMIGFCVAVYALQR